MSNFRRYELLAVGVLFTCLCGFVRVGDVVSGEVVRESDDTLSVRTDPCDPSSTTITFSAPWRKRSLNKKVCHDNSSHNMVQVEQLAPPPPDHPPEDTTDRQQNSHKHPPAQDGTADDQNPKR